MTKQTYLVLVVVEYFLKACSTLLFGQIDSLFREMRNVRFYLRFLIFSAFLVFIGYESAVVSLKDTNNCKQKAASHETESQVGTQPVRKELKQTKDAKNQR